MTAQSSFARTSPRRRADILTRAFELLHERIDDLALLMTLEMGKPLAEARTEVSYGAEFLRWFSEEAVRIAGRYSIAPSGGRRLRPCIPAVSGATRRGHERKPRERRFSRS